jgi:hypothetical protein
MCKMHYKNPFQMQDVNVYFAFCDLHISGDSGYDINTYCSAVLPQTPQFCSYEFPMLCVSDGDNEVTEAVHYGLNLVQW